MNDTVKNSPVLIDRANDVSAFCSVNPSHYVITGVYANDKGTEASDGYIAIRVPFVETSAEEFPACANAGSERLPAIIPVKPLKEAISKAASHKSNLSVLNCVRLSSSKAGDKVQFVLNDLDTERVIETRPIEGQFPKLDAVWPDKKPDLTIELSAELLSTIVDYALKHGEEFSKERWKYHTVKFAFNDELSPVRFTVQIADGRKAEGVLMPCRMS